MRHEGRVTRVRPSLTCIPCKRRKVKCEKRRPSCQQCLKSNISCSYEAVPVATSSTGQASKSRRASLGHGHNANTRSEVPRQVPEVQAGSVCASPGAMLEQFTDGGNLSSSYLMDEPDLFSYHNDIVSPNTAATFGKFPFVFQSNHISELRGFSADRDVSSMNNNTQNRTQRSKEDQENVASRRSMEPFHKAAREYEYQFPDMTSTSKTSPLENPRRPLQCHVSRSFWAFAGKRVGGYELFLQAQQRKYLTNEFNENRRLEFRRILQSIPSKKLCDLLLRSFLTSVRPLLPLVHVPTLQADYKAFWADYADGQSVEKQDCSIEAASFSSLLWAILYCGATAASPSIFTDASFQIRDAVAFRSRLKSKLEETLALSCHKEIPTLNGLVASVLVHECNRELDANDIPLSITHFMHVARMLGLHSEEAMKEKGQVEAEMGRRVWFQILHLEAMATIATGSPLSCSSNDYDTIMPGDVHDEDIRTNKNQPFTPARSSSAMILTIGRYETIRVLRRIVEKCFGSQAPRKEDVDTIEAGIFQLHAKLDHLISRLQVRGLPEQGRVSSQLLEAKPAGHLCSHLDHPQDKTVFNAFARIALSMMKHHLTIFFGRATLSHNPGEKVLGSWNKCPPGHSNTCFESIAPDVNSSSTMSSCIHFLRNYLHLARLPAFSSYRWFCPGTIQPLQECMMVLDYLKEQPQGPASQLLQYLLNEVFDIFWPDGSGSEGVGHDTNRNELLSPWLVLHQIYEEIKAEGTKSDTANRVGSNNESSPSLPSSSSSSVGLVGGELTRVDLDVLQERTPPNSTAETSEIGVAPMEVDLSNFSQAVDLSGALLSRSPRMVPNGPSDGSSSSLTAYERVTSEAGTASQSRAMQRPSLGTRTYSTSSYEHVEQEQGFGVLPRSLKSPARGRWGVWRPGLPLGDEMPEEWLDIIDVDNVH